MKTIEEIRKESIFEVGEKIENAYFTKDAYLAMLTIEDEIFKNPVANVTFAPSCRNNWHSHPGGQLLLVTAGHGFYQEEGKSARALKAGNVVQISPNVKHWHGASDDCWFAHLAMEVNKDAGSVEWMEVVDDTQYYAAIRK